MIEYTFLACTSGNWKLDNGKSGISYYLIVKKPDACKPVICKATEDIFKKACTLKGAEKLHLFFDENQRAIGMEIL